MEWALKILTSLFGNSAALVAAVILVAIRLRDLSELPKTVGWKSAPEWVGPAMVGALLVLLASLVVSRLLEQRRIKRYSEMGGSLKPGYFRLQPRESEEGFERADNAHVETLRWVETSKSPVLYLTGASGTGKSSVVAAWVVPKLSAAGHVVIRLRGYEDLAARMEGEVLRPGVVWERQQRPGGDLKALLARARRNVAPKRIVFVIDQFEEFLILKSEDQQKMLRDFLAEACADPLDGVTFLLAFRSEYQKIIDNAGWPARGVHDNLKEIFAFGESEARDFLIKSQRTFDGGFLSKVLREASEIEQGAVGLIRPITLNLVGLVLGRFASGLPRGFRGGLIRGFLRESISLPETRETATKILPKMLTGEMTKRPRTVAELAAETGLRRESVRACLLRLGSEDRGIVRALDPETRQTWEVSHDFLAAHLEVLVAGWRASLWRRWRPWMPWIATATLTVAIPVLVGLRTQDPVRELTDLGWTVSRDGAGLRVVWNGQEPSTKQAGRPLGRLSTTELTVKGLAGDISSLKDLKNLTSLDLSTTAVSDVSALKNMRRLNSLNLGFTVVEDVSPLKDLENLHKLELTNTRVRDLSALKDLKNLTELRLPISLVEDVSPLKDLKSLRTLILYGTKVRDVSALRDNKALKIDGVPAAEWKRSF